MSFEGQQSKSAEAAIAIFRSLWLPASETFILSQMAEYRRFAPVPVGIVANSTQPPRVQLLSAEGLWHAIWMRATGDSPRIDGILQRSRASLIHAHHAPDGLTISCAAKRLGLPLIVTSHGSDVLQNVTTRGTPTSQRRLLNNWPKLISRTARFIAVSRFVASALVRRGVAANKIEVVPTGVAIPAGKPIRPRRSSCMNLLFVGRLAPNKGVRHAVAVAEALASRGTPVNLTVIGDGPDRSYVDSLVPTRYYRVESLGTRRHEYVLERIATADAVIAPSVTIGTGASEGLNTVVLEAMARNTLVAAYMTGGLREACANGSICVAAPEGEHEVLAKRLFRALADPSAVSDLTANAHKHVEENYNLRTQTCKVEQLYADLLST